jgi:hypothetical protein
VQSVLWLAADWTTERSEFDSRYGQEFSLLLVVQTSCGVHPASYPVCAGETLTRIKRPGRETRHSPPTSAEVKETWIYTSTPLYVLMA